MPPRSLQRLCAWLPLMLVAIPSPGCLRKLPTGIEPPRAPAPQETSAPRPEETQVSEAPAAPVPADGPTSESPRATAPDPVTLGAGGAAPVAAREDRPPAKARPADPSPKPVEPSADPRAIPRLLLEADATGPPGAMVYSALTRAERLLPVLRWRRLDPAQRKERDAGVTFIVQARQALALSEADRAAVLADKAVALIENLELATRP